MNLAKSDTPETRQIWKTVEEAAKGCPEWVRGQVQAAAEETVRDVLRRQERPQTPQ